MCKLARAISDGYLRSCHDKGKMGRRSTRRDKNGLSQSEQSATTIKLTPTGQLKVLDFGLAKIGEAQAATDFSNSPTLVSGSMPGVILGTAAYMSPEQAKS